MYDVNKCTRLHGKKNSTAHVYKIWSFLCLTWLFFKAFCFLLVTLKVDVAPAVCNFNGKGGAGGGGGGGGGGSTLRDEDEVTNRSGKQVF